MAISENCIRRATVLVMSVNLRDGNNWRWSPLGMRNQQNTIS